jgi:hypothetical protein
MNYSRPLYASNTLETPREKKPPLENRRILLKAIL